MRRVLVHSGIRVKIHASVNVYRAIEAANLAGLEPHRCASDDPRVDGEPDHRADQGQDHQQTGCGKGWTGVPESSQHHPAPEWNVTPVNITIRSRVDNVNMWIYDRGPWFVPPTARPKKKRPDQYHHGDLRRALLEEAVRTIQADGIEHLTLRGIGEKLGRLAHRAVSAFLW